MTPFQELKHDVRLHHPEARVYAFKDIQADRWHIEVQFNATTFVQVHEINGEDFTEDFLSDDLTPAILDQREGGKFQTMSYRQAKELSKHLPPVQKGMSK